MKMTKRKLDDYFSKNHGQIQDYIKNSFFKNKIFFEEPDYFLSECYLYVLKHIQNLETDEDVRKYISTFIHNNTRWSNSSVREDGTLKQQARKVSFNPQILDSPEETYSVDEEIDYEGLNEMYYQSLTTMEERAVWEIYFHQGMTSYQKFGKHIGRSKSVGAMYITWLRNDMKRFLDAQINS